MTTRERRTETLSILHGCSLVGSRHQSIARRIFAIAIAFALVLPAIAPAFVTFTVRSTALFLRSFVLTIGFGLSYYVLLYRFLEDDDGATEQAGKQLPTRTVERSGSSETNSTIRTKRFPI